MEYKNLENNIIESNQNNNENNKIIENFIFFEKSYKDYIKDIYEIDLIFVLGNTYIDFLYRVYDLYKKNNDIKILVSGGYYNNIINGDPEYLIIQNKLIEMGVPIENILIEKCASNTKENIIFSKEILESYNNIIIFCKAFHTKRVSMYFNKYLNNQNYYFEGIIDNNNISKEKWLMNEFARNRVYDEFIRIGEYIKKGDL